MRLIARAVILAVGSLSRRLPGEPEYGATGRLQLRGRGRDAGLAGWLGLKEAGGKSAVVTEGTPSATTWRVEFVD